MQIAPTSKFSELGFYGLPGHTRTPRDVFQQVRDAEELGVGNVMLSERSDYKEISVICGACAAHLHTFLSDGALSRAVEQFRACEAAAGKEVGRGKVWSVFATACDVSQEVAPVLAEYEKIRPNALFEDRTNRPV